MQTLAEVRQELRTHLKLAHGIEAESNHWLARNQHEADHEDNGWCAQWEHDVNDWYAYIDQA